MERDSRNEDAFPPNKSSKGSEPRFCRICGGELDENDQCPSCNLETNNQESIESADESEEVSEKHFCRKCGSTVDGEGVCPRCGTRLGVELVDEELEHKKTDEGRSRRRVIAASLGSAAALLCAIVGVVSYGIDTAVHWEKVDNPGNWVEQGTGCYNVTMDEVDPCYIGQDWTDCINAYVAEYNRECTKPLGSFNYGPSEDGSFSIAGRDPINRLLCGRYSEMISDMQAKDGPGYYVSSLGSWGHLHSSPETEYVQVGYESHEAVCYFGFLGECPE